MKLEFYHEPRYKRVKEILDSGKLGKITYFTQTVFNHMSKGSKYHGEKALHYTKVFAGKDVVDSITQCD